MQIPNPIKLAFRLAEVPWREEAFVYDQGRELKAIPLREIFADELERTLWLAIKSRHITSQYFNHMVREAAALIRRQPPCSARELHIYIGGMTGAHWDDRSKLPGPDPFCEELLRYVLSVLDRGEHKLEYEEPAARAALSEPSTKPDREAKDRKEP